MREPLKLSESEIIAAVDTHYGLSTAAFSFLPLGNDTATSVYHLGTKDGATFFVKVRTAAGFSIPSLAIPQFLQARGVPHILAPVATLENKLWVMVGEFALTLYPFIQNGRSVAHVGMTDSQWQQFGTVVRRYHELPMNIELLNLLPRDRFVPKQRELIPVLEAVMARGEFANDAERKVAEFWYSQRERIQTITRRADSLGAQLAQSSSARVLCHADLHTHNVLMDQAKNFWLVDWDEVILALPERDLMFVVGGISRALVTPQQSALFLEGYGDYSPDACALTYYRYAWAVQDLAAYGATVFLLPDLREESRHEAVSGLMRLFATGEIIEIATASETSRYP